MPQVREKIEDIEVTDKPCGCEPGRPCPVALVLLAEAMDLHERWTETRVTKDWQAYLAAKRKYDAHRGRED